MKINHVTIILILSTLCTACFAPINSTFESAKLLDKGEIELQGNYSKYYFGQEDENGVGGNLNNNLGFGFGYGISDQFNMKFRYERMDIVTEEFEIFDNEFIAGGALNYVELGGKFQITQDKIAISIPLGGYFGEELMLHSIKRPAFPFGQAVVYAHILTN